MLEALHSILNCVQWFLIIMGRWHDGGDYSADRRRVDFCHSCDGEPNDAGGQRDCGDESAVRSVECVRRRGVRRSEGGE